MGRSMESFDDLAECKHCGMEWDQEYEYCPRCHRNFSGAEYPEEISNEEFYNVQKYGVAYGFENIDFAKLTYSKMIDHLKQMEQNTFTQCTKFVILVKSHFIKKL
jgi:predicted amidophosphoribosyltransferase